MNGFNIDVPVFMNFFNRPETFKFVFAAVKAARPSKVFLSCDGPRNGRPDDIEKINQCKEIAEGIDWECEVYKNYSDVNLGCDKRMFSGISWAFQNVDRLIILEDDCVPNQSFFVFCKELLEKYKDDQRINMISGMNNVDVWDKNGSSYFFAKTGSIWGWATWKRVWDNVDEHVSFMEDDNAIRLMLGSITPKEYAPKFVGIGQSQYKCFKDGNRDREWDTWEFPFGFSRVLNSQLIIVPKYNMISNIGLTFESTHATNNINKLTKKIQRIFNKKTFEMDFPLVHPKYIIDDADYADAVGEAMGGKFNLMEYFEFFYRRIRYYEKGELKKIIKRKFSK